eukprot:scaffold158685_cov35-Tisochrysis_lutea.AAC.1
MGLCAYVRAEHGRGDGVAGEGAGAARVPASRKGRRAVHAGLSAVRQARVSLQAERGGSSVPTKHCAVGCCARCAWRS